MRTTIKLPMIGIAGLVTTGLLALPIAAFATDGDQAMKRDEDTPDVVLVADEDDDDTNGAASNSGGDSNTGANTGGNSGDNSNTGSSRSTNDNTASNFTGVSKDNDLSRSDKTRDKTQDGPGGTKRDWSGNKTNDASRNDSRG